LIKDVGAKMLAGHFKIIARPQKVYSSLNSHCIIIIIILVLFISNYIKYLWMINNKYHEINELFRVQVDKDKKQTKIMVL